MPVHRTLYKYRRLIESFLSLSVLNGVNIVLPLITLPYILRVVGASNYGKYSYVYVIVQYILIITSYGFNYSSTKQISQCRDDLDQVKIIYNAVTQCRLLLLLLCALVVGCLSQFLFRTPSEKIMMAMGMGIVLGDILNPVWLFQGMEKMRFMTFINFSSKLFFTVLIFLFVKKEHDYVLIILFNSLGFILSGILSMLVVYKYFKIKFSLAKFEEIKNQYKLGFEIFISTIGINLYTNANVFILNFFVGNNALGIYSACEKIIKGLKLLSTPVSQAFFPHLGYKFKDQQADKSIAQLKKISLSFSLFLFVFSFLTFIFADQLMSVFGGEKFSEGVPLIRIMSVTIILGGLNSILGFSGLVNLNKQKEFLISVLFSGVTSVFFILILVPIGGIVIGAWAVVVAETILFMMLLFHLNKLSKT